MISVLITYRTLMVRLGIQHKPGILAINTYDKYDSSGRYYNSIILHLPFVLWSIFRKKRGKQTGAMCTRFAERERGAATNAHMHRLRIDCALILVFGTSRGNINVHASI